MLNKKTIKKINTATYLNSQALWQSVAGVPTEERLGRLLESAGVRFYDEDRRYIKKPQVAVSGIGGLPITWSKSTPKNSFSFAGMPEVSITPENVASSFNEMIAYGGFMSYLNPKDRSPEDFTDLLFSQKHFSTTHMVNINVTIFGVSTSVENEFCCQRDIIHIARLTEARTKAQNNPPVCVLYPDLLALAQKVSGSGPELGLDRSTLDRTEAINLLHPSAKATMFTMSGSLKNFQKLVGFLDDAGKEEEMKRVLAMLNDSLHAMFPGVFKETTLYNYEPPAHLLED